MGTGLQVGQLTMEAISLIKAADKVFYCIADAPGEQYIQSLRPDAMDLYVYYSDSRVRYHTYVQMSETLLYYVRKGYRVVGVFYGHPGVFVDPSHRAMNIANIVNGQALYEQESLLPWCGIYELNFDDAEFIVVSNEKWYLSSLYYNLNSRVHYI